MKRLLGVLVLASGCSSSATSTDVAGVAPADVLLEIVSDSVSETAADPTGSDPSPDLAACTPDERSCDADGITLRTCENGAWKEVSCMAAFGQLCEAGVCVDPWRYGSPKWSTCPTHPAATAETLAQKAAYYDAIAMRLHVHPDLKWAASVSLKPGVSEATATWKDVAAWQSGENDGLWSALYLASQAFRYGATKSADALAAIRLCLQGEETRMKITGVPGVFTRQFIPPGVPGIACPTDDAAYTTDAEKDDNRWVQIRDDGCIWVVDRDTKAWTKSGHCGLDAYKGWCFLDNVSQDEYAGHMLALGALVRLVDAPDVQTTAKSMIEQVGVHLMEHDLTFVDWDGRVTEHGKLYATSFADTPGFLAAEALGFVKMAAEVSGRDDLKAFYEDCLLQRKGETPCLDWPLEVPESYVEYLPDMMAYVGPEGCKSNYNNFSMVLTYLFDLIEFERDPAVRVPAQEALDVQLMRFDSPRRLIDQKNAWYNFIWAKSKKLGPGSDGPAFQAVEDAICSLREFPASKARPTKDPGAKYPHYCEGRLGSSQSQFPIPVAERCPRTFLWWGSPYSRDGCTADPTDVKQPGDYLLAYWMGRYYGFISETL